MCSTCTALPHAPPSACPASSGGRPRARARLRDARRGHDPKSLRLRPRRDGRVPLGPLVRGVRRRRLHPEGERRRHVPRRRRRGLRLRLRRGRHRRRAARAGEEEARVRGQGRRDLQRRRLLVPAPDGPVMIVKLPNGISTSIPLRLCFLAFFIFRVAELGV